jgi:3-hydroxybutyryl-CoA dehydrogenase
MNIRTVGVVGAGVMGTGVAQNLAQAGYNVILVDISDEVLAHAERTIISSLRLQRLMDRSKRQTASIEETLQHINFVTDYKLFTDVEFVIENTPEKWDIKKSVYSQIDLICPERTIFAVNTSAISITRVGSVTKRPDRVIGTHFMNPVPMKDTVEVIRGYHTSEQTIASTRELLETMGKTGIVVNDMPGFVSNRVLMLTINEAVYLVQDQVAAVEDIDTIFESCFGHKMGPLKTADLIGLDTILYSIEVLYESFNDSKYRPCPLLKKMVDAGLHGRKNGQGFYHY